MKRCAWILDLVGIALVLLAAWAGSLRVRGVIDSATYHLFLGLTILEVLVALGLSAWYLAPGREVIARARQERLAARDVN